LTSASPKYASELRKELRYSNTQAALDWTKVQCPSVSFQTNLYTSDQLFYALFKLRFRTL
jgi:hypothetical protein